MQRFGRPYSQCAFLPQDGEQIGGMTGGTHSNSGLPMKNGKQTHWLVALSQRAPTPQVTPSQRSLLYK